ncbi:hypothetical protein [Micavibrio aeruginosavorus]|uniref:hypothetical protein n=1 Tax=Micavibrio aeruginosavorus TaxID=349221 RepID=UPI003F4AEA80
MAKKPHHYYTAPRTDQQAPRNPSLETSDIIVTVEPPKPADDRVGRLCLDHDIKIAWHKNDQYSIRRAYTIVSLSAVTFVGLQGGAVQFNRRTPEQKALSKQKDAVADLAATFKGADAPLPNTSQAVMDLRSLPEGEACWKKYTNDPASAGSVHGTLVQKCLADEVNTLNQQDGGDFVSVPWLLCIAGAGIAFSRGFKVFKDHIAPHQKQCKAIRNNPLYNGEALPGPIRQTRPTGPEL